MEAKLFVSIRKYKMKGSVPAAETTGIRDPMDIIPEIGPHMSVADAANIYSRCLDAPFAATKE